MGRAPRGAGLTSAMHIFNTAFRDLDMGYASAMSWLLFLAIFVLSMVNNYLFSRDGGKTFGQAPLKKLVTVTEDGKTVQREVVVPPAEYTAVRWVVSALKPDTTLKLGFRVKVK